MHKEKELATTLYRLIQNISFVYNLYTLVFAVAIMGIVIVSKVDEGIQLDVIISCIMLLLINIRKIMLSYRDKKLNIHEAKVEHDKSSEESVFKKILQLIICLMICIIAGFFMIDYSLLMLIPVMIISIPVLFDIIISIINR